MKRLVRFTMSGINSIITDHFKMFFRDVLSKPWHEIKNRDGFDDQFLVFMAIVMEGNELAVIFVNSRCGYNRATEIAADIFDYGFRITFIRFGINIEAMFMFRIT